MAEIQSKPYQPNPDLCCEACVFKRGQHATWCAVLDPHELDRLADDGGPQHDAQGH